MTIAGIDPGKKGGIAIIHELDVMLYTMPLKSDNSIDAWDIMKLLKTNAVDHVLIEKVHAMPGQGVTSMFTFGEGYGKVCGAVECTSIPYELVAPQTWKASVLRDTKKDKDAAIVFVERMYPQADLLAKPRSKKPHDGLADALCIAHYGRVKYGGKGG